MMYLVLFYSANTFPEKNSSILLAYNENFDNINVTYADATESQITSFMYAAAFGIAINKSYGIRTETVAQPEDFSSLRESYLKKIELLLKKKLKIQDIKIITHDPSIELDDLVKMYPSRKIYLLNTHWNNKTYTPFAIHTVKTVTGLNSMIGIAFSIDEVIFNDNYTGNNKPSDHIAKERYKPKKLTRGSRIYKCFKKIVVDRGKIEKEYAQDVEKNGSPEEEIGDSETSPNHYITSVFERTRTEQFSPSKFNTRNSTFYDCTKKYIESAIDRLRLKELYPQEFSNDEDEEY